MCIPSHEIWVRHIPSMERDTSDEARQQGHCPIACPERRLRISLLLFPK